MKIHSKKNQRKKTTKYEWFKNNIVKIEMFIDYIKNSLTFKTRLIAENYRLFNLISIHVKSAR